tara:strand:+ start:7438 stop:7617 length:180 start_codon:yes stop_codon:yes gene_type:complete
MSFKLVDTVRGKVLAEYQSRELAEKALSHMVNDIVELQESAPVKKRASKKVKASVEEAE